MNLPSRKAISPATEVGPVGFDSVGGDPVDCGADSGRAVESGAEGNVDEGVKGELGEAGACGADPAGAGATGEARVPSCP